MTTAFYRPICALALAALLPLTAQAHRAWLLPSSTIVSGGEPWVTVDAAISDSLFYFDHHAMALDGLRVSAPDGTELVPEQAGKGRLRSSFDVKLAQKGTYRMAVLSDSLSASFQLKGQPKRVRGTAESLAHEIPGDAESLNVTRSMSRTETFVTVGKPSEAVLHPSKTGLELVPVTHPNDLVVGEAANFRFLLDGQPAAGLVVTVVPGGIRYRDVIGEMKLSTDAQGEFSVKWPSAGMYYLTASAGGAPRAPIGADGKPAAVPAGPRGTLQQPLRRAVYGATLEVMPQ